MDILNKVVLITGAGRGAGRALALALAQRGAIVAANDITPINVDEVMREIVQNGGQGKVYIADIAKKVAVQALIKDVQDDFGRIDVLINHASVAPRQPLLEMDEWDWARTVDVNLTGAFLMIQSVGRVMREQGRGLILNIMERSQQPENHAAAYYTSLAGFAELTRRAETELSQYGIKIGLVEKAGADDMIEHVLGWIR